MISRYPRDGTEGGKRPPNWLSEAGGADSSAQLHPSCISCQTLSPSINFIHQTFSLESGFLQFHLVLFLSESPFMYSYTQPSRQTAIFDSSFFVIYKIPSSVTVLSPYKLLGFFLGGEGLIAVSYESNRYIFIKLGVFMWYDQN